MAMKAASGRDAMPDASAPPARSSSLAVASSGRVRQDRLCGGERARILTPEQDARAVRALGVFKAKRDAFLAGVSLEQLDADVWVVDVDAVHAEVA
jgi:hypothetical protein